MVYIPIVTARALIKIFLRLGFVIVRQVGSHIQMMPPNDKSRRITIPYHNRDLSIKTLKYILRQANIGMDEFIRIIRNK